MPKSLMITIFLTEFCKKVNIKNMTENFKPKITLFYCINAFDDTAELFLTGKDTCEIQTVKMPCSSMVKDVFLLRAFEAGSDAVVVLVCPEGQCRFLEGNIRAKKRVAWVQNLLDEIGLNGQRLSLSNIFSGDKITVSQQEINNTIERIKESRQFTEEQLRQGLASQGMTMEEYRNEIQEQILRTKLVNREVKSKIVITKEDIKEYYDGHREKYAGKKKYHLWNMFIKVSSGSGSFARNNARNQMEAILAKLKQGRSFESLINEIKNSSSAVQGTDLGLYRLEEVSEQLRQVTKNMGAGEFSGVLDTNFGYQILYVQEIENSQAKPLEAVESEIEELLYNELVDNKYQEWLEGLRARSHIRIIN